MVSSLGFRSCYTNVSQQQGENFHSDHIRVSATFSPVAVTDGPGAWPIPWRARITARSCEVIPHQPFRFIEYFYVEISRRPRIYILPKPYRTRLATFRMCLDRSETINPVWIYRLLASSTCSSALSYAVCVSLLSNSQASPWISILLQPINLPPPFRLVLYGLHV